MRVAIHQPHYLPWLRYVEKIARSDVFIVLDTVEYTKNGWQNRNKIKTASGAALLTAPVHANLHERLDQVRLDNTQPWRKKHWATIEQSYRKAPHYVAYSAALQEVYAQEWELLNDLNRRLLGFFVEALRIRTRIVYASELGVAGQATERLVNLVKAVGGDEYYTGAFALDQYLDQALFENAGIAVALQEWRAPVYPQLHGPFVPDLSIVDLLMNCGPDSLDVLSTRERAR